VRKAVESDKFYHSQLFSQESQVLEDVCTSINNCTSKGGMWDILRGQKVDKPREILADLCRYHFLEEVFCMSHDVCIDKHKRHPKYKLKDAPLSVYYSLKSGKVKLSAVVGLLFEDMVRDMLKDKCTTQTLLFGYWKEPCTEIDIVLVDELKKVVYWGSCKLKAHKQDASNLMAHVVSYFNNRGWQLHEYFTYHHVFLFISPTFCYEDQQRLLKPSVEDLNAILSTGRSMPVKEVCCRKLSNYANSGAAFEWWPPQETILNNSSSKTKGKQSEKVGAKPEATNNDLLSNINPNSFFQIDKFMCLSLTELRNIDLKSL